MKYIIGIILAILGLYYACKSLHANEFIPNAHHEISCFNWHLALNQPQVNYYKDKIKFHRKEAEKYTALAQERCWWLPKIQDRDKAKLCWTTAFITVQATSPTWKLIGMVTNLMMQAGLDVIDEWNSINTMLRNADFNFEMASFYEDVIKKG